MRTRNLFCLPLACFALACAMITQASTLPDLRGRTFAITGTISMQGTLSFGLAVNESASITTDNPTTLVINNSGPTDNSMLTGSAALGTFDSTVDGTFYPGCQNPTLPLTSGAFNLTTGVFTMKGTLTGTSVIDLGVYDLTDSTFGLYGVSRIMISFLDLGITVSGTGSVDSSGVFHITNTGANAFTYRAGSMPLVSIQSPDTCTFQNGPDTYSISNGVFKLSNWTTQVLASGNVILEGVPDLANVSPGAPVNPITFDFRTPNTTNVIASRTAALMPVPSAPDGAYKLTDLPIGTFDIAIKGEKNLQQTLHNVAITGNVTLPDVTLPAGDANNDNQVDLGDFGLLVNAFGNAYDPNPSPDNTYDPHADFNFDGIVDVGDFGLLVNRFGDSGDM